MKALGEQFAQTAGILIEVEKPELAQSDAGAADPDAENCVL
ncbi:MAG: hypothetical protein ACLR23_08720 [Clostridia bacterium]